MYRNVNFSGFADPNYHVQLYSGLSLLGGAQADASGKWSATTSTLADGNYTFTAAALDQAGNKSMLSLSCPLTVDGTTPSGTLTSPTAGTTVTGTVAVAASAADQVGVWKVDFQVDGVTKGNTTAAPYRYLWGSSQAANGSHTVAALVTDNAGNTVSSAPSSTSRTAALPPPRRRRSTRPPPATPPSPSAGRRRRPTAAPRSPATASTAAPQAAPRPC